MVAAPAEMAGPIPQTVSITHRTEREKDSQRDVHTYTRARARERERSLPKSSSRHPASPGLLTSEYHEGIKPIRVQIFAQQQKREREKERSLIDKTVYT